MGDLVMSDNKKPQFFINDGFEFGYKIVSCEVDGHKVCSVVDKFGNILENFNDGEVKLIPLAIDKCFAVGKDSQGETQLYMMHSSLRNPDDHGCELVSSVPCVIDAFPINKDRLLIFTQLGLCFFDTNYLEMASDFYDELRPVQKSKHDLWFYEKEVGCDYENYVTRLSGIIDLDGRVEPICYDSFFDKERELNLHRFFLHPHDVIIVDDIQENLNVRAQKDGERAVRRMNKLAKVAEHKRLDRLFS